MAKIVFMKDRQPAAQPAERPMVRGVSLRGGASGGPVPLLDAAEREALAAIGTVVRFPRGAILHDEGEKISAIFNITEGVVKTYRMTEDGRRHVLAFLFPGDLVGLYAEHRYLNTAEAVNTVTAYRLPIAALEKLLERDPALNLAFLSKACHDLRQTQRHEIMLARREARQRLLMFLDMLAPQASAIAGNPQGAILSLPMRRVEIADYLGLSAEAVSRGLHALVREGKLRLHGLHQIEVLDRGDLAALTG
ncbi:Crp/Fnr family transcriptional regulator [Acidibrevibacterium fodinaquatile]|uniref:Crp/Fnr family transcriptional regulator n=1 Tax=Acidibrevibacterium fodinaquatile TaxID=1969806 RepID=UPI000E0CC7D8|nr:Crp/Fnr family transcriptional regulator [Acidibrevibacterium fodinaquatile]